MKAIKVKESVAELTTDYGKVSFHLNVFQTLIRQAIIEIPGVTDIEFRNLFGKSKGQNVVIKPGETADQVTLQVEVWLAGPVNVIEVGTQIQKRLKYDIEKCLGVQVEEVLLTIANIVFE